MPQFPSWQAESKIMWNLRASESYSITVTPRPLSAALISVSSRANAGSGLNGDQSVISSASLCAALEGLKRLARRPVAPLAVRRA